MRIWDPILPLGFAKALSTAVRAFGESLTVHVDSHRQLIGLGLEFRMATGADKGSRHQYDVTAHGDQGDGNGNIVPRHVSGLTKPVYRAGGQGEDDSGQDEE